MKLIKIISLLFVCLNIPQLFAAESGPFSKSDIEQIRISITSGEKSLLDMKIARDGMLGRQGNGEFPVEPFAVAGQTDSEVFNQLVKVISPKVFAHANTYDHPDKSGIPITYSIVFLGEKPKIKVFKFHVGTETKDVGKLLPYFGKFIAHAVQLTDKWYSENKSK